MADDESESISSKSWARAVDQINKTGYMDGAADGQSATFQSSFDLAYKQGLDFGLKLGYREAVSMQQDMDITSKPHLLDQRRINCQICIHRILSQENINSLHNTQKEKNYEHLQILKTTEINR